MELYPTISSVGVRLAYTGDANANATAHLEWRAAGSTVWTRGVEMNRITAQRWAGSVLWLLPQRAYEIKAVIDDPDSASEATGTITTRSDVMPGFSGRTVHVATSGSDSSSGGSDDPLATLQAAVAMAQPGDQIMVAPGIYHQTVDLNHSGTAADPIHLVAEAPGVILDGSDPDFLSRSDWRDDGGGIYSLPFSGVTRVVCVDSLMRLFNAPSLSALQTNANGLGQGWVIEGGRLWLRLEGGVSPDGHVVHVARHDVGIRMQADHWRVAGFEVRYFGTLFPNVLGHLSGGITLIGAKHCIVTGCHVHTIGGRSIFLRSLAADNLIENNWVRDPRIGGWPWDVVKGTPNQELTGISNRGGRGNVIRFNTVTGTFNGVDGRPQDAAALTDENAAADCDIHDNVIEQLSDDGIETDEISGINVRIYRNRMSNVFSGFSTGPVWQGPEYILYNTVVAYTRGAFKPSNSSAGWIWICHNSTYSAAGVASLRPGGKFANHLFRNNILGTATTRLVDIEPSWILPGNHFDADILYRFDHGTPLFKWGTSYNTLAQLRAATGFELLGFNADPLFVSAATGNLRVLSGSPAVDAAIRLDGINDDYLGAAPDIGAFEGGVTVDVALEPAMAGLRLDPPRPSPTHGPVTIGYALPREALVVLRVFDLTGRRIREIAGETAPAGPGTARWDGRDLGGRPVPTGVYLVRMDALGEARVGRILVLR